MSEKSVATKLGLKPGKTLFIRHVPGPVEPLLGVVSPDSNIVDKGNGPFRLILVFAKNRREMEKELAFCKPKLEPGGALWLAYAKETSRKAGDINRDDIREYVETIGLTTVAQIAIDQDWSAMRLKLLPA